MRSIVARVSRGTVMDQIYLPKHRSSALQPGAYVIVQPVQTESKTTPVYYGVEALPPIKAEIATRILEHADAKNVIITGSFLEDGSFDDIDIIVINGNGKEIEAFVREETGLHAHVIELTPNALRRGLSTDPLFEMMLSRCVAKKRLVLAHHREVRPALLDAHLLQSKPVMEAFDQLSGKEKYKLVRNSIAIRRFVEQKRVSSALVNREIETIFGKGTVELLKNNIVEKEGFLRTYRQMYNNLFNHLMRDISAEQKQAH